MRPLRNLLTGIAITGFLLTGCNKQTDSFTSDLPSDYFNLAPGKYILYDLDSTIFVDFGQHDSVIHYQAKDVVDTLITDNLDRQGWRVIRYLRDAASTNEADWTPNLTYMIIPGKQNVEVIENNLRYLKVQLPVSSGFSWKGNSSLPSSPYQTLFQFSNDEDIQSWDYNYESTEETAEINDQLYPNTISITQAADSVNVPVDYPEVFAYRNYWNEKYSKGIGLVSKEVSMWEYQPPNGASPGYRVGYGISLRIREHN
jgi:hypothetical protein